MDALPHSNEHDRLQLDLRVALGTARMANFGWAHPSVSEALEPAFPLARTMADEDALGSILWGLWVHYQTRTNFPQAHEWLDRLEKVAQEWPQSDLPLVFDMSAGCQYFWEADYDRALRHTDRLKSAYDTDRHARITELTNHDPLVFSQHWAGSLADWIAGRPERSVERLDEAVTLARKIGHPFNLVFALTAGATSLVYLDQTDRLLAHCDEAAAVAAEEALGPFSEHVNIMQWRGAAYVQRGDHELGYALAKRGNDFWTDSGGRICTAMFGSFVVCKGSGGSKKPQHSTRTTSPTVARPVIATWSRNACACRANWSLSAPSQIIPPQSSCSVRLCPLPAARVPDPGSYGPPCPSQGCCKAETSVRRLSPCLFPFWNPLKRDWIPRIVSRRRRSSHHSTNFRWPALSDVSGPEMWRPPHCLIATTCHSGISWRMLASDVVGWI